MGHQILYDTETRQLYSVSHQTQCVQRYRQSMDEVKDTQLASIIATLDSYIA